MGWSDEGRGCQMEGRNGGDRGVVVDGEEQTHDMCMRGQSRPYPVIVLNTVENRNFCSFNFENMLQVCQIYFNQNG